MINYIIIPLIFMLMGYHMIKILTGGFFNPFSYFKLSKDIKSGIQSALNPYWKIKNIGSITFENTKRIRVFVEFHSEWGWTNDFVRFTKINGNWIGDYEMLKLTQGIYDEAYQKETGIDLKLKKLEDDRDAKLREIGI